MSKEVILKYLTEFNAWVKGQEVYVIFNNGGHRLVDSLEDFNEDVRYILLKDSYFPYRIALAEGKTVQCNAREGENDITYTAYGHLWWVDTTEFKYATRFYRIKPEEPKFKVGDFVRYIHTNSQKPLRIINIHCERYYFENAEIILRVDEIEKWEPKEGEICIFWDTINTGAVISKFSHMEQEKYGTDLYTWNNCMPFTGTLPPHMKDNK